LGTLNSVKKNATDKEDKKSALCLLDDEMSEMLKVAQNSRDAMKEMNDAFVGNEDSIDYVAHYDSKNKMHVRKVSARKKAPRGNSETLARLKSAMPRPLPPIEEELRED